MYFASRTQAGRMLASRLAPKYRYENCAVLALDDGGAVVGAQIAMQLHCVLTMLSSAEIMLPLEPLAVGGITSSGEFSLNHQYSQSDLDEMISENRGFIDEDKLRKMHDLNHLIGHVGTVNKKLLQGHNIIVVSDGLKSPFAVDLVYEFLKPIKVEKIIFAVVIASVESIDRMHVMGDDLYCIDTIDEYLDKNHYYDKNDVPSHQEIIDTIQQIILKWK